MSPRETDVLVIGGGATGVGVARDCAMRGLDVELCERGGLGSGTSGRSHGLLHSGARYAVEDPEGAEECIEENRILRKIGGACVRRTGGYVVQLPGDDTDYFERLHDACESIGIDVSVEAGDRAREAVPELTAEAERVLSVPDAVIYPSRLVAATAESARQHGAAIHTHAPVTDLHVAEREGEDGDAEARVTGATIGGNLDERVDAAYVVNATGAWAGELATMADLDVAMRPTRGVMVAVESPGLDTVLNRCRAPSDGDIVVPHEFQAILGTTSVAVDDPDEYPKADWEIERTIEECAAMVPDVRDREPIRTYWGVRPLYEPDEAERAAGGGDERGISRGFALLDHRDRDDVDGMVTIVGGKLTTHRLMAEAVTDLVGERLDAGGNCTTASEQLAASDDPEQLDSLVGRYDAGAPADEELRRT